MTDNSISLSADEQITLRRVAFGESPAHTLRPGDLVRLRHLRLIADGKDGPYLTAAGRTCFESLPKPTMSELPQGGFAEEVERIRRMKTGGA